MTLDDFSQNRFKVNIQDDTIKNSKNQKRKHLSAFQQRRLESITVFTFSQNYF